MHRSRTTLPAACSTPHHLLIDVLNQDGPVSSCPSLNVFNALSRFLHRPLGDPGLDVLVSRQLKHSHNFGLGADVRRTDERAVAGHGLRSQSRPVGLGHTVPDKLALGYQAADELVEGKTGVGGGADDDVQAHSVLLCKVTGGGHEVLGSHLQSIVLLSLRMRENLWARHIETGEFETRARSTSKTYSDFGSKRDREEDSVVAETTEADHTDLGSLTDVVAEQGTGRCDTGAQPFRRIRRDDQVDGLVSYYFVLTWRRHLRWQEIPEARIRTSPGHEHAWSNHPGCNLRLATFL